MAVERPNTISGLLAKRAELVAFRKGLERELRKVTCDLDHLDAAIRLFGPEPRLTPLSASRPSTGARQGQLRRIVLAHLRDATEPATACDQ